VASVAASAALAGAMARRARAGTARRARARAAILLQRLRTGTPGAARGTGTSGSARSLNGTVSLVNGSTLTVKDSSGGVFQVKLTGTTQIIETKSATASALKVGQPLTVAGTLDSQGAITATVIAILLALPQTNRPEATATP